MDNLSQKTKSGLFFKFAERVGAQGVNFLVSIVLARLLLPEEFGLISMVIIYIAILDVFVTYGFGNSLIVNKDSDDVDFSTCFYFSIGLSTCVYVLVFFTAGVVEHFFDAPGLAVLIQVMGIRIPIAAVNSVQQAYVSKKMMFRKFFFSTSIGTVVSGIISIILAYQGFGVWALAAQYLINTVMDTVCLWFLVGWRPKCLFSFSRLKKIYDYGWKILAVGLIDTGYNQLRSLMIAKQYTPSDLAYYGKGSQFPSLGMSIVEPTITGVIFPALSNCNDRVDKMRNVTRRITQTSSFIFFPIIVLLLAIAKPLVIVLLTEKWLDCVIFLQISCLAFLLRPIQVINVCVIQASGKSGLLLKMDILKKGIGVILLLMSFPFGVEAIAWSLVVTNLIAVVINVYPNKDILEYGYRDQLEDISSSLLISCIMGIIVFSVSCLNFNPLSILILQVTIGMVLFIALSVITKNKTFKYLISTLIKGNKYENWLYNRGL